MRKIKSQRDIEKEKRKNQIIIGLVLVFLMVFSSIGYALMSVNSDDSQGETARYGNLEFIQQNGYWNLPYSDRILFFDFLPNELGKISIDENISITDYFEKEVYFVGFEDQNSVALQKIAASLQGIATRMQEACLEGLECSNSDLPTKTCQDHLIIYTDSSQNSVTKTENCVYINGEIVKTSDAFVYRLFNIA